MLYSENYLKELQKLHSKKTFGNSAALPEEVKHIIESKNIKSFLDFGAGKGKTSVTIKNLFTDINLYTYDPVTFPIALPDTVEFIYSSDVLEHIEPTLLDKTIEDLSHRSSRYQYHLIACHPAKKSLSDGRNAHLIIEKPEWWRNKLQSLNGWKILYETVKEYDARVKKGPLINVIKYIVILEKTNEKSI
jgi:hypothetical protein